MKKQKQHRTTKLALEAETIRALSDHELTEAQGGRINLSQFEGNCGRPSIVYGGC